jgi:DNA-binding PadR family transcriptional regulator
LLPDRKVYHLTDAGQEALEHWLAEPTVGTIRLKDEFFVKLLVCQLVGSEGLLALIWKQRQVYMQTLAQLTALRTDPALDAATTLLMEGAILHVEADLEWLDICEDRLKQT